MAMRYQQDLQVSLHERLRRLMVAAAEDASHEVRLVVGWLEQQPAIRAILAEAELADPGLSPDALAPALQDGGRGLGRQGFRWPSQTEAGRAFLIWQLMRNIAVGDDDETDSTRVVINYAYSVSDQSN